LADVAYDSETVERLISRRKPTRSITVNRAEMSWVCIKTPGSISYTVVVLLDADRRSWGETFDTIHKEITPSNHMALIAVKNRKLHLIIRFSPIE
jgi:hypothetical protein